MLWVSEETLNIQTVLELLYNLRILKLDYLYFASWIDCDPIMTYVEIVVGWMTNLQCRMMYLNICLRFVLLFTEMLMEPLGGGALYITVVSFGVSFPIPSLSVTFSALSSSVVSMASCLSIHLWDVAGGGDDFELSRSKRARSWHHAWYKPNQNKLLTQDLKFFSF